jgi:hypothetical protein
MNGIKCMLVNSVHVLVKWRIKTEQGMGKKEENTLILFQLHAHKDIMMN